MAAALPGLKSLDFTPFSGDEVELACRMNPSRMLKHATKATRTESTVRGPPTPTRGGRPTNKHSMEKEKQ